MNKQRLYEIFSSVQMNTNDRKYLIDTIMKSGGINEKTPLLSSVTGTELVPIFDGTNKAVNVNELIKGGKEIHYINPIDWNGIEDYNKLYEAFRNNKLIIFGGLVSSVLYTESEITELIVVSSLLFNEAIELTLIIISFDDNKQLNIVDKTIRFKIDGDGTKYLSDDGSYKTIEIPDVDLSNYYTKEEVNDAISSAEVDLSNYAKKEDIVTYENATQTSDGLMSKEDKTKLDNFTGSEVVILTSDEYTTLQANGELKDTTVYYIKD